MAVWLLLGWLRLHRLPLLPPVASDAPVGQSVAPVATVEGVGTVPIAEVVNPQRLLPDRPTLQLGQLEQLQPAKSTVD